MATFFRMTTRAVVLVLVLALMSQYVQPGSASAASATLVLNPTSGPAGTTVGVSGQNYAPNQQVNIYFNGQFLRAAPADASGNLATTFVVPSLANATYTVAAVSNVSATAPFTITSGVVSTLTVTKSVSVNGAAPGFAFAAAPGATLTYYVSVRNNSSSAVTGAVIYDVLSGGQTAYIPPGPCNFSNSSPYGTVVCSATSTGQATGTIAPGATATVSFATIINGGFNGTIPNSATATSTTTGGTVYSSNQTLVTVGSVVQPSGSFEVCGQITQYTPAGTLTSGSITIAGVPLIIAANASVGAGLTLGNNLCIVVSFNGVGQAQVVATQLNLAGTTMACGTFAPGFTTGTINVSGVVLPVAAGTNFPLFLYTGATYCFLLSGGTAYAALSVIPTSIAPAPIRIGAFTRRGPFQAF